MQITGCYLIQVLESQICGEVIVSSSYILSRQCFEITYYCLCLFTCSVEWPCRPLTTGSTASNAMWDDVVRLNAEFGIDTLGSPRPHTPPSSSALEVDPVSWNILNGTWSFSWLWPGLVSSSSGQVGLSWQHRPCLQRNWITWMFDNHFLLVDVSLTASHKSVHYKEMKHFLRNGFCVWATEIPKPACTWATPGPREYVAALPAFGFCSQPTPPIRWGRRRGVGWIGRSSSWALE